MPEIGATLREARMRARIDVSEIEAQTKIRARYLRALENEEWDLLPGPTFIKSFLRTYATALGLDGKALVEEYRANFEHPSEQELQPIVHQRRRSRPAGEIASAPPSGGAGPSRGYMVTVGLVGLLIVILIVGLLTRGSSPKKTSGSGQHGESRQSSKQRHSRLSQHFRPGHNAIAGEEVSVTLQATAPVWVCLINGAQQQLIPGVDLQAGQRSGPFRAKRFEVTLGNASVTLSVNGRAVSVPQSTTAIGYSIGPHGTVPLAAGRGPTCA